MEIHIDRRVERRADHRRQHRGVPRRLGRDFEIAHLDRSRDGFVEQLDALDADDAVVGDERHGARRYLTRRAVGPSDVGDVMIAISLRRRRVLEADALATERSALTVASRPSRARAGRKRETATRRKSCDRRAASLPLSSASLRTSAEANRGYLVLDTEPRRPRSRTPSRTPTTKEDHRPACDGPSVRYEPSFRARRCLVICGGDRDRGSANDAEARSAGWLTARPQRIS